MQRALVVGASGHIGNAVVRELLARGCAVTAARRGRSAARNLAGLAVRDALGDADHPATLDAWVAGHDLVVDAAAPYPLTLADTGAIAASERRAVALVDAVARHRTRLVHVGSFVTALGNDDTGRPRVPGQRLDAELHPYFAAKRAGEAVFSAAARAGAPITIVQPTTCLGPWDCRPSTMCLVPRVLAGQVPAVPSHVINVIDVRDVARAVVAAATGEPREPPLLLSGHNVGLPELCALIGELAGTRVTTRGVPAAAARAGAWLVELAAPGAEMPPVLLPTLLALRQSALSVGAAQRALGASPRPLSVTLRDAIAWHRDQPPGEPTGGDPVEPGPGSPGRPRVRRPRPARIAPVRDASGMFRIGSGVVASSTDNPAGVEPAAPPGPPAWPGEGPVGRAMQAGYDVVEKAVQRGFGLARDPSPWAPSWHPSWIATWPGQPASASGDAWNGAWTTGRWIDAMTGALARWAAAPRPASPPIAAPAPGPEAPRAVRLAVELRTARAAEVELDVSVDPGSALEVHGLAATAAAAPPIRDVAVELVDGRVVIALGALDDHPAGTYVGAVLTAGKPCGMLRVRLT